MTEVRAEGPDSVPPRQKAPTIYDVARLAGVSHQTVSRHIKGHRISDQSRERVEKAIDDLDFQPNSAARSLATRSSRRIGALAYEMTQLGPMTTLSGAASLAREAGFVLDIVTMNPVDPTSARAAIDLVKQNDLAGILAFTPTDDVRLELESTRFRVPVYVEHEVDDDAHRGNLNYDAAAVVAEHLLGLGHRSFAHVAGPGNWPSSRLRAAGFADTLRAAGVTPPQAEEGDWNPASGFDAMTRILRRGERFTAVFAANDQMAIGAIAALAGAGLRVPDDVSVAGIDDIAEAAFVSPTLTTVPMRFAGQGRFAFRRLLAMINGETLPELGDELRGTLVVRQSTGAPADASR
ncbi:LacI family DNA-binding transcriptional regulator [Frondihabitans australicus]|uniref:LacI family transcriptional regulator n=1 Tax=Frondihabitans australicus TaxID=386892 RepID=A0A495IGB6_9MICO|nr:LacI family DNA-binding transcriptional regulator [Frondihabitans australicus]RKR74448.1 LacI family transcriptional regulator [Frondihabitans australicus]